MRTHLEIDDKLLEETLRLGKFKNRTAAVNAALEAYADILRRRELLNLRGRIHWKGNLDTMRRSRVRS